MVDEVRPGQLVSSTQGRDAGRFYLVLDKSDLFVMVTDGKFRGLEKPKKKNLKHLKIWPLVAENLAHKLAEESKVSNSEIVEMLKDLTGSLEEEPLLKGKEVG
ncbi:KOW domain-containing RNA-binding protein [Desulforamulus ruminis]|uniref:Ribosomal protein L14E n=1 Tax=Desulforamulus ruminis (strain ATCC 23193 / DSM 2154 / NCIMB 8452 / DL) TaxID=696281 RepID=F6DPE4_DESRL|nr:KOW domain-containing RNA-binding protein [Desulforamulus ruminis]AEG58617.1 ribosomal protein L14E [Desulforamulus ruminis DSM 2154]